MSGRLAGWRVLVTRQPEQARGLAEALAAEGASVVEVPLIEIAPPIDPSPLRATLDRLAEYSCLIFTSANAVRAVAAEMGARTIPSQVRVAAVGPSTAEAVTDAFPGTTVDLTPDKDFSAEGLLAAFAAHDVVGARFLIPASARARDTLAAGLRARGAWVSVVTAYRTVTPGDAGPRVTQALAAGIDLVTFASPSAVEGFASACPDRARWPPAAVIGPVTESAARANGFDVRAVAGAAGAEGLVDALCGLTRGR